MSWNRLIIFVV